MYLPISKHVHPPSFRPISMLPCCLNSFIMLWIMVLDILNISANLYFETPSRWFFMITCLIWVAKPLFTLSNQHKYWWRHQQYCDVTILFDLWPEPLASMTCTEVQRAQLKSPPLIISTNSRKRTWSRDFIWSPGLPLEVLLERDWSAIGAQLKLETSKEAPDFSLKHYCSANEARLKREWSWRLLGSWDCIFSGVDKTSKNK